MFRIEIESGFGVSDVVTVASREEVIAHIPAFRGPMWWLDDLSEPFTFNDGDWSYTVSRF